MLNKTFVILIFSALLVGTGVSFAFANVVNPDCPPEVRQAIQDWDNGLEARNSQNQQTAGSDQQADKIQGLRSLFLSSLVNLTFNTPIHSQIQVVKTIQKLFTIAKHYLGIPNSKFQIPNLSAIFIVLKKFLEKVIFLLLGLLILSLICNLSTYQPISLSTCLYYKFHNLRL